MFSLTKNNKHYVASLKDVQNNDLYSYTIEVFDEEGNSLNTHTYVVNSHMLETSAVEEVITKWLDKAEEFM